jgi:hypothetical protein
MARRIGTGTKENAKIVKCKIKDIPWDVFTVNSTYDDSLDDWMLDGVQPTGKTIMLSQKTSNEQVIVALQIDRRKFKAFISKNEIFVCNRKDNPPSLCIRRSV